jgi:hypothetical protein
MPTELSNFDIDNFDTYDESRDCSNFDGVTEEKPKIAIHSRKKLKFAFKNSVKSYGKSTFR